MASAGPHPYDRHMASEGQHGFDPNPDEDGGDGAGADVLPRDRFAQAVIERVRAKFPLVKIGRARQPFSVRLNGHVASLENLYRISRLKPGDLTHQIERWAVELLRAGEGSPDREADLDSVADRLMPMLLRSDHAADAKQDEQPFVPLDSGTNPTGRQGLVTRPLVPGLRVGYVIDGDRTIAYVSWETLERWNIDVDRLHERSLENLVQRSDKMNAHAAQGEDGEVNLVLFQSLDGFDASRLLLPNLHERLRGHLGSPFAAAVPNRDILLCFRDESETIDPLRGQIRHDFETMPHQVTERLVLVTADGLAAYD